MVDSMGIILIVLFVFSVAGIIAFFVANDAKSKGQNPYLWALVAIVGNGVGLII